MSDRSGARDRPYVVISSDDHGGADLLAYKPYTYSAVFDAASNLSL